MRDRDHNLNKPCENLSSALTCVPLIEAAAMRSF